MQTVGWIIYVLLYVFLGLLFVRFIFDWVQVFARSWVPSGPLLVFLEAVYTVTDPPIKALRRLIPPLRLGAVALDLSFLIVMILTYILIRIDINLLLA